MIKLSIIIPVYNSKKYILQCVESLLMQKLSIDEYEILLIDDGSSDGSSSIVNILCEKYHHIRCFHQSNAGQGRARNVGLDYAKGRYVTFVDSDDYITPNTYRQILEKCNSMDLDVCEYQMARQLSDGTFIIDLVQPFCSDEIYTGEYALLHGVNIASVCTNVYRKSFIDKYGLRFHEQIKHEDVEFNARMYAFAQRIMFTDICGYVYRWNPVSTDRTTDKEKRRILFKSDIFLICSIRNFVESEEIKPELGIFYRQYCNSILVSLFLFQLFKKNDYSYKDYCYIVKLLIAEKLYPIKGVTKSRKTTLLIPLINTLPLTRMLKILNRLCILL